MLNYNLNFVYNFLNDNNNNNNNKIWVTSHKSKISRNNKIMSRPPIIIIIYTYNSSR